MLNTRDSHSTGAPPHSPKFMCTSLYLQSKKSKSREKAGSYSGADQMDPRGRQETTSGESRTGDEGGGSSRSSKKKKKKMQKVNPAAMLGFTVNAAERPNMGEIQSVRDAL